jgi:hypothetical protein
MHVAKWKKPILKDYEDYAPLWFQLYYILWKGKIMEK